MKVRPLHDRVIIERIEETEQRVGGIIIPDSAKEKPQQGKVVAAGKGKIEKDGKVTPLDVKAGDTILFDDAQREFERTFIARALSKTNFNVCKAAKITGLHRNTLSRKMAAYRIKKSA